MFTWICQQCGRENPPNKTECPNCEEIARQRAAFQQQQPPAPPVGYQQPVPAYQPTPQVQQAPPPPVVQYAPQQYPPQAPAPQPLPPQPLPQQYWQPPTQPQAPPPQYGQAWPAPAKRPMPSWVAGVIVAVVLLSAFAAFYIFYVNKPSAAEKTGVENPSNPSKAKVTNPLQKQLEVVGIRLSGDAKKSPVAKFIVVNHGGQVDGLSATVTLWASTSRSEEDSIGSFTFKIPQLGSNESKELTAPLKTKLKLYELPDWQNANPDLQITAP